jgi:hypothetical protein
VEETFSKIVKFNRIDWFGPRCDTPFYAYYCSLLLLSESDGGLLDTSELGFLGSDILLLLSVGSGLLEDELLVVESHLGVVLLLGIEVVVDKGHSAGSATTELGVESNNGDSFLLGLEHLGKVGSDLSLGDVGELGVNEFDTNLLSGEEGVLEELTDVEDELSVCHKNYFY